MHRHAGAAHTGHIRADTILRRRERQREGRVAAGGERSHVGRPQRDVGSARHGSVAAPVVRDVVREREVVDEGAGVEHARVGHRVGQHDAAREGEGADRSRLEQTRTESDVDVSVRRRGPRSSRRSERPRSPRRRSESPTRGRRPGPPAPSARRANCVSAFADPPVSPGFFARSVPTLRCASVRLRSRALASRLHDIFSARCASMRDLRLGGFDDAFGPG